MCELVNEWRPSKILVSLETLSHGKIQKAFGIPLPNGSDRKEKNMKQNPINNAELKNNYAIFIKGKIVKLLQGI